MSPHLMAHFLTSSGVSEWTNERSAVECPSGASKWVSRVSKWVNKQARGLALTSGFVLVLDHSAQVQHALSFLTVSIKVEVVFLFSLVPLQSTKQWHPRQLGRFGKKVRKYHHETTEFWGEKVGWWLSRWKKKTQSEVSRCFDLPIVSVLFSHSQLTKICHFYVSDHLKMITIVTKFVSTVIEKCVNHYHSQDNNCVNRQNRKRNQQQWQLCLLEWD